MQPTARHPGPPSAPVSAAATAALAVATEYCSPALLNHSVRSYLWAAEYARRHDIEVDHELLYVAAVLHDLGLVAPFDSHLIEFEHAGGHVAWVFAAGAGWPVGRRLPDVSVSSRFFGTRVVEGRAADQTRGAGQLPRNRQE